MELKENEIRLFGVATDSIVDGPGLRYSVYVQGCSHHCPECHNPESWAFDGGTVTTIDALIEDIQANKLIHDVTLSGGDPFDQPGPVAKLASRLKDLGYGLWSYSGYTYEQLQAKAAENEDIARILSLVDVLVDGPFKKDLKSLDLKWKGSANQRVIDMKKTREADQIVLFKEFSFDYEIPENW